MIHFPSCLPSDASVFISSRKSNYKLVFLMALTPTNEPRDQISGPWLNSNWHFSCPILTHSCLALLTFPIILSSSFFILLVYWHLSIRLQAPFLYWSCLTLNAMLSYVDTMGGLPLFEQIQRRGEWEGAEGEWGRQERRERGDSVIGM